MYHEWQELFTLCRMLVINNIRYSQILCNADLVLLFTVSKGECMCVWGVHEYHCCYLLVKYMYICENSNMVTRWSDVHCVHCRTIVQY